jgi:PleD family two-component response regulator
MNRPYILVVDDNAVMAKLICRYLEINDFEVHSASDGVACLEHVAQRIPDVILTDVMMPRMDGLTLISALQSNDATRRIPVIVITALNDHETMQRAIQVGAVDVIAKPIDETVLTTKVRLLTGMQRAQHEVATLRAAIDAYERGDVHAARAVLASLQNKA